MSTPVDWETIRDLLRDVVAALRETATATGKNSSSDAAVATALRDARAAYRELVEVRAAGNAAALAHAREEGRVAGYQQALDDAARASTRQADTETSSAHLVLISAVAEPAASFARSPHGQGMIRVLTATILAALTATAAWVAFKLGGAANGQ